MNDLDINNLPEEYTTTIYIYWNNKYQYANISDYSPDDDDPERFLIAEPLEVTFKIRPKEDTVKEAVDGLRKNIEAIRARANVECNKLEEKIQSLLALPNMEK